MKSSNIIVFTAGVFDLLHPGHLNVLKKAKSVGDKLIVGLQADVSVKKQKGYFPILPDSERKTMLKVIPFVDAVVFYEHQNYLETIKAVKPDVVVQGGDWFDTGDRKEIMEYLNNNSIKFIKIPYTLGISTTDIKERILDHLYLLNNAKYSLKNLSTKLAILPISKISVYEKYDPTRTDKLVEIIEETNIFVDPITIGQVVNGKKYVVIDGANRLQALKRLGVKNVLCYIVNYLNNDEVRLINNKHYLEIDSENFFKLIKNIKIKEITVSFNQTIGEKLAKSNSIAIIEINNRIYTVGEDNNLSSTIDSLNNFVKSYVSKVKIFRLSEMDFTSSKSFITITFKKFNKSEILNIIKSKKELESGITWHRTSHSIIRFKMPLSILKKEMNGKEAKIILEDLISKKIENDHIRRYLSSITICDEW